MASGLVADLDGNGSAIVLQHFVAKDVRQDSNRFAAQAVAALENLAFLVHREAVTTV
nr:hypothetical protein [Mesorhizobium comanense]